MTSRVQSGIKKSMQRFYFLLCLSAMLLSGAPAAHAAEAPYDDRLSRLSEIMGSMHFLRNLCNEKQETQWRGLLEKLVETETVEPDRRARVIAAFNHGYRSFASVYSVCTSSAIVAIERYTKEGANLANEIVSRYGY